VICVEYTYLIKSIGISSVHSLQEDIHLINVVSKNTSAQQSFNTKMMLVGLFGMNPFISLEQVCNEFLSLSYNTALRKARLHELPFPALRLDSSQKSPWLVSIDDLAEFVDQTSQAARSEWKRGQI